MGFAALFVVVAGCGQKGPLVVSASAPAARPVSDLAPSASQPASVPR